VVALLVSSPVALAAGTGTDTDTAARFRPTADVQRSAARGGGLAGECGSGANEFIGDK
jgi:hypothetical protein